MTGGRVEPPGEDGDEPGRHRPAGADGRRGAALTTTLDAEQRERRWSGLSRPTTSAGCGSTRRPTTAASRGGPGTAAAAPRPPAGRPGLSSAGYVTVAVIMGLENVLDEAEGWTGMFPGRTRGRDPARYYLRVSATGDGTGRGASGPPCVDPPDRRRRGAARRRLLHRRGPRFVADARAASAAAPGRGRGDSAASAPLSTQGSRRQRSSRPGPTDRHRRGQPPRLRDGDLPIPLPEIWRGAASAGPSAAVGGHPAQAEKTIGLGPSTSRRSGSAAGARKGIPPFVDAGQQELLRASSRCTCSGCRRRSPRPRRRRWPAGAARLPSPGPAASSRASPTTTGSKALASWSSSTTRSAG